MITSANNTQVKNIIQLNQKAKARREQGLFVDVYKRQLLHIPLESPYLIQSNMTFCLNVS